MIVEKCLEQGLKQPDFESGVNFGVIFWRDETTDNNNTPQVNMDVTPQVNAQVIQVPPQVTPQVVSLLMLLDRDMNRTEIQAGLQLHDRENIRLAYIQPALKLGLIEMTIPDKPNSRLQKYRLTQLGKETKEALKSQ